MNRELLHTRTGVPYSIVTQGVPKHIPNKVKMRSVLTLRIIRKNESLVKKHKK
jgi:hypothetical protein